MTIYVDENYRCHCTDIDRCRAIETDFFDDKCPSFIEGYCYDDSKGYVSIYPWKPYSQLAEAQKNYEDGINSQDETIAELMDEIASLCEELIGE